MGYIARNISNGYAYLLKQEVQPGATLDLEKVFEGFCKPKKSSKAEPAKYSEYTKDQFSEFLDRVKTEWAADRTVWQIEMPDNVEITKSAVPKTEPNRKTAKRKTAIETRASERRITNADISPKEMAWLEYNDASKKLVHSCSDARKLKMALKLARNLAGRERMRDLIEDRIQELSVDGVV